MSDSSFLQQLLKERQKVLSELASIETLLRDRCGWLPEAETKTPQDMPQQPIVNPHQAAISRASVPELAYRQEACEWLKTKNPDFQFRISDFVRHLIDKYGEDQVNASSARGPFPSLVQAMKVKVVRPGAGRASTIYQKHENFDVPEI